MNRADVTSELEITEPRHVIRVNVAETAEVQMDLRFSTAILSFVRLYDPAAKLVAIAGCMNGRDRISFRLRSDAPTLNALPRAPIAGEYTLVITTPLEAHQRAGAEVRVSISPAGLPPIPEHELIASAGFDGEGRATDQVTIRSSERRYYRGDLHGHTTASDGLMNDEEAMRLLEREKLDYMAITEHNLITFGHRTGPTMIVPAFELTLPDGHLNVYGVDRADAMDALWSRFESGEGSIARLVPELRDRGYLVSINHMFLDPWAFTAEGLPIEAVDAIEIICDPTYPDSPKANEKAVAFLDFLWSRGVRVYGVGGSDSHHPPGKPYDGSDLPSIYGDPSTWVFCDGLSVENLLDGTRLGHSYVARFIRLDISIDEGRLLPGDCIPSDARTFAYEVRVADFGSASTGPSASELTGEIVLDGAVVASARLSPENPSIGVDDVRSLVGDRESWWLRTSVRDRSGSIVAYVNPIYGGAGDPAQEDVDALIAEFEGR